MASRKPQIHREALHQLLRARPALDRLLDSILTAGADEGRTTVDELLEDGELPRKQAINLLRDLEGLGYGSFKVGRKGHPSRFEWSIDPEDLRKALDDDNGEPSEAPTRASFMGHPPARERDEPPTTPPARAPQQPRSEIEHLLVLRPDYRVTLNLPADLTRGEAQAISEWVRILSFER